MSKNTDALENSAIQLTGLLVLLIVTFYSYVYLFLDSTYRGFLFNPNNGIVQSVYIPARQNPTLQAKDIILSINQIPLTENVRSDYVWIYGQPGTIVPLTVQRDDQTLPIEWVLPGFNQQEFVSRIMSQIPVAWIFWLFGMLSLMMIRPVDHRVRLLAAFNYLTAFWIVTGTVSNTRIFNSGELMRIGIWLSIPIYWRFFWCFPQPVFRMPKWIIVTLYSASILLSLGEVANILPSSLYMLGFILLLLGSLVSFLTHLFVNAEQRHEILRLILAVVLLLVPSILVGLNFALQKYNYASMAIFIAIPALPGAFLYHLYRRQPAGLQLRTNHEVISLLYTFLVSGGILLLITGISNFADPTELMLATLVAVLTSLLTITAYPRFERWAEHRLLGMPLPPTHLVEIYAARIISTLKKENLILLMCDEILPTLLIRQAALVQFDQSGRFGSVCLKGIDAEDLPLPADIPSLVNTRLPNTKYSWIRLALPLKIDGRLIGAILLGKRDPDDRYAANEIPLLQTLMDQTALALENIAQTEQLHALYKADIDFQEAYRGELARELHDDVLGSMALLMQTASSEAHNAQFIEAYQTAEQHARSVIQGLRPAALDYGLHQALDGLAEWINDLNVRQVRVEFNLPDCNARYPEQVELYLYRIVQQSCLNSLNHSNATCIRISGRMEENLLELVVEDNGQGFTQGSLDLPGLLANNHFGLAGMFERAQLIDAGLKIQPSSTGGVKVLVTWKR